MGDDTAQPLGKGCRLTRSRLILSLSRGASPPFATAIQALLPCYLACGATKFGSSLVRNNTKCVCSWFDQLGYWAQFIAACWTLIGHNDEWEKTPLYRFGLGYHQFCGGIYLVYFGLLREGQTYDIAFHPFHLAQNQSP